MGHPSARMRIDATAKLTDGCTLINQQGKKDESGQLSCEYLTALDPATYCSVQNVRAHTFPVHPGNMWSLESLCGEEVNAECTVCFPTESG